MQTTLTNAVRVIRARDDAEYAAEFERYNYGTHMWVAHIVDDYDYEWAEQRGMCYSEARRDIRLYVRQCY